MWSSGHGTVHKQYQQSMFKNSPSNAGGVGLILGQGAKVSHASWPNKSKHKTKQYCNKFNKNLKNGPHKNLKKEKTNEFSRPAGYKIKAFF